MSKTILVTVAFTLLSLTTFAAQNKDEAKLIALYKSEHELNLDSNDILVEVIDTGIDAGKHPSLLEKQVQGLDFYEADKLPQDEVGHGTHVSGIIVDQLTKLGTTNYKILPVRACGTFDDCNGAALFLALKKAIALNAKIINISIQLAANLINPKFEKVFNDLREKGVIVVICAGNRGKDLNRYPEFKVPYHLDNVVVVGSTNHNGTKKSSFSNYSKNEIDLYAEGENVRSTFLNGGQKVLQGTSQAAPIVTANLIKIMSDHPNFNYKEVIDYLIQGAAKSDALKESSRTGAFLPLL